MNAEEHTVLLQTLKQRFEQHMQRHPGLARAEVQARLAGSPAAVRTLAAMEASGGEPDVVVMHAPTAELIFCDGAAESPAGRRSLCYDRKALDARNENKPTGSAVDAAAAMGLELMSEVQYRALQAVGEFDTKTSSWVHTPPALRAQGGALFCDRRYGWVFVYHNGAQSYYAARGFRGWLLLP